jgi:GntR family transcriptional regulator, trigonelline degradation regulator
VRTLNTRINRLRALTISSTGRGEQSNQEMNTLLAAIEKGDGNAAYEASAAHIRRVSELAQEALSRMPEPE